MNEKEININDELLDKKKKILNNKEDEIMKSQIIQNKLEDKIRKLEIKKKNIIKGNKWLLGNIIYTSIYDTIMIMVLILFITTFTNKINLIIPLNNTIYVIGLTLGVLTISMIGAYISANVRDKLKYYCSKKRVIKISERIKEKECLLEDEIKKQENMKKEITNIMNEFDNRIDMNAIDNNQEFVDYADYDIGDKEVNNDNIKTNKKKRIKR